MPLYVNGAYLGSVDSEVLTDHCRHTQLKKVGGCKYGCCDDYVCKLCGRRFRVEVPD